MDDREGAGIGVVDADLLGRELVLDQLVLDALVGQRAGGVEAERLEIARQHLHRRDAAGLDRLDELGARGEREILAAPQAEPLGIGEIVDGGGAGRRDVDDARVGQRVLQPQAGAALLRGGLTRRARPCRRRRSAWRGSRRKRSRRRNRSPAIRRSAGRAKAFSPRVVGAQRGVGGEQDAFRQPDRRALAEARQRRDQQPLHAERRPVALGVLDQLVGLGDPDRACGGPCSQLSRMMPATWRPLPAPVPSPRNQPRRKRTAFSASSGAAETRSKVSSTVQDPARIVAHGPRRHR